MANEPFHTSIRIPAPPERIFPYLVRSDQIIRWMGDWADIEPTSGGRYALDINGVRIRGHIVEHRPPERLVVAWGHLDTARFPPGSSRLVIELEETDDGETLLHLSHHGLPTSEGEQYGVGWLHFVERLVILASGADPGPDPWATDRSVSRP